MLSVLHLHSTDLEAINSQLANLLSQAPGFLEQAPVVLEAASLVDPDGLNLGRLISILHQHTLIPVALRGGTKDLRARAGAAGLALMSEPQVSRANTQSVEPIAPAMLKPSTHNEPQVVTRPVRSGQQIYAEQTDLVILGAVSAGAEIIADGDIHVYGVLRGRALAGARGQKSARIFCQSLEAELLAIAGCYRVLEIQPEEEPARPAHVWLKGERLMIDRL